MLATMVGLIVLCSLGTWQIFRLAEKTKMIASLEARMDMPPISLAEAVVKQANGEDIEYLPVKAEGRRDYTNSLAKITSFEGKPSWEVIIPFISDDGIFVLVDAGVSTSKTVVSSSDSNEILFGIIRLHKKGRGFFDNDNDEAGNTWYWWDLPAMQATAQAPPDAKIANFIIQKSLIPTTVNGEHPAQVELSNNHLGYAITWFGLAAALLAVAGFFARSLLLDRSRRDS